MTWVGLFYLNLRINFLFFIGSISHIMNWVGLFYLNLRINFLSLLGKISHIMTWVGLFYLNLIFNIMEDETSLPLNIYIIGITIDNT
jgi:hypothetical protein